MSIFQMNNFTTRHQDRMHQTRYISFIQEADSLRRKEKGRSLEVMIEVDANHRGAKKIEVTSGSHNRFSSSSSSRLVYFFRRSKLLKKKYASINVIQLFIYCTENAHFSRYSLYGFYFRGIFRSFDS